MNTPNQRKSSKLPIIILALLLLISLGGVAYLFTELSSLKKQFVNTNDNLEETTDKKNLLQANLKSQIEEFQLLARQYETRGIENEDLNEQLQKLEDQQKELKNAKSYSDKKRRQLEHDIRKLLAESELKHQDLEKEIEHLKYVVDSQNVEMGTLVELNGEHIENISSLSEQVRIASIMRFESTDIKVFNKKGKLEKPSKNGYKADDVRQLVIDAKLAQNSVSEKGNKTFIMKMTDASGQVIYTINNSGGSFETDKGKTELYSLKKILNFKNSGETLTLISEFSEGMIEPGKYIIKVYEGRHLIKTTELKVK